VIEGGRKLIAENIDRTPRFKIIDHVLRGVSNLLGPKMDGFCHQSNTKKFAEVLGKFYDWRPQQQEIRSSPNSSLCSEKPAETQSEKTDRFCANQVPQIAEGCDCILNRTFHIEVCKTSTALAGSKGMEAQNRNSARRSLLTPARQPGIGCDHLLSERRTEHKSSASAMRWRIQNSKQSTTRFTEVLNFHLLARSKSVLDRSPGTTAPYHDLSCLEENKEIQRQ